MIPKKCKNCNQPYNSQESNFCNQECFDIWIARLISDAIFDIVNKDKEIFNERVQQIRLYGD